MYKQEYEKWLKNVNEEERSELYSIKDDDKEIKERFSLPLAFGTAGMRGTVGLGTFNMNNYTVMRATQGLSKYIISLGENAKKKGVVISYDTRRFSFDFALVAAKVLAFNKINVFMFENVRPVPMCSFAVRRFEASAGIMITASHNPKEYNGYKVYGPDGAQLDLDATDRVVDYIKNIDYFNISVADVSVKAQKEINKFDNKKIHEYITIIGESIDKEFLDKVKEQILSLDAIKKCKEDLKIVYTPVHGTGAIPITRLYDEVGINYLVVKEQFEPDTEFSTVSTPNPEQRDVLEMGIQLAKNNNADIVLGTDPDCDRMGVAIKNQNGEFEILNGNQIGSLMLYYELLRRKELNILPKNAAIVKTIVTTRLADKIAEDFSVKVFDVLTGFKFIGEKIKEWEKTREYEYIFGFEESFGYLAGTHARDKDAVVAAAVFADMAFYFKEKGLTIKEVLTMILEKYGYFVEKSKSIVFKGLDGMDKMKNIMKNLVDKPFKKIDKFEIESLIDVNSGNIIHKDGSKGKLELPKSNVIKYNFNDYEWACVRPSGTEPKLKIYVSTFGSSYSQSENKNKKIVEYIEKAVLDM